MKSRFLLLTLACVLVASVGTAWASRTPFVAAPDPACAFPDKLATAELYERAGKEYDVLLVATPDLQCAQEGLIHSSIALTPTPTPNATPFAQVRALNSAGQTDEAKKLLVEEIKANPDAEIPRDLSNLVGNPLNDWKDGSVGFGQWINAIIGKLGPFSVTLLTAIAAIIALGLVAQQLGRRIFSNTDDNVRIDIGLFNTDLSGATVGRLLTESVQAAFESTQSARPGAHSKLVEEAAPAATSGATVELLKVAGNPFSALYEWLKAVPSTVYVLEGTTLSHKEKGAGIGLTLKLGNEIKKTQTIWQSDFQDVNTQPVDSEPTLSAYLALAEPASIWLYDVTSHLKPRAVPPNHADGYHLAWRHWKSYALFRAALVSNARGETSASIILLHRSLALDPYFLPARMNLYTIEMQDLEEAAKKHDEFYEHYANLYKELYDNWTRGKAAQPNTAPTLADAEDVVEAKLSFNYLAAADYRAGWEHPSQHPPDAKVRRRLESVIERARTSAPDSDLREMAQPLRFLGDTLKIRFGELSAPGADQQAEPCKEVRSNDSTHVSPVDTRAEYLKALDSGGTDLNAFGMRSLYGIACLCVAAAYTEPDENHDTWVDYAFGYLHRSIQLEPKRVGDRAATDWSLQPLRVDRSDRFKKLVPEKEAPPRTTYEPAPIEP